MELGASYLFTYLEDSRLIPKLFVQVGVESRRIAVQCAQELKSPLI